MIANPEGMKKVVKQSGKSKGKSSFYLAIFNRIKEGKSPSDISKEYKIPKQNIRYYTNNLKKWGLIGKHKNKNWFVKVKTFSLGTKDDIFTSSPKTNLHALQINIPILSGEIRGSDWEIKEELKNWTPKYKKLNILGGLTLKNNNNKSVSIFAHTRDIKNLKEIDELSYNIRNWASNYFRDTFNVILDIFNTETKMLHIATEDKNSEGMIKKGEKFELDLDKKAEKVFPKDKIDAKAWIDGSPFDFSAETNDKEWKRAYLSMPFSMQNSLLLLHYIAKNYASHIGIVEKLNKVLEEPKVRKHIRKKTNQDQTRLGDFL